MAAEHEEDVNRLLFGSEFEEVKWLPNAMAALIMITSETERMKHSKKQPSETFSSALDYAQMFSGALAVPMSTASVSSGASLPVSAVTELCQELTFTHFTREGEDGEVKKVRLHDFQIAALVNLNPPTRECARALIPSLDEYTDDELQEILTILRRGTSKLGTAAKLG